LLCVLLTRADEPVSADALAAAIWEREPDDSGTRVAKLVYRLREAFPVSARHLLETVPRGYRLHVEGASDIARFERAVADARVLLRARSAVEAVEHFEQAMGVWSSPPFGDFASAPFAWAERSRLEQLHATALEDHLSALLELGRDAEVIERATAVVAEHPYRERIHEHLMTALYRSGRQVDALEGYDRLRRTLRDDLGVEPSPALRELERAILRHEPLGSPPSPSRPAALPTVADDPERSRTGTIGHPITRSHTSRRAGARGRPAVGRHGSSSWVPSCRLCSAWWAGVPARERAPTRTHERFEAARHSRSTTSVARTSSLPAVA
jgi:DNA-binding SARP family transcriptional activator